MAVYEVSATDQQIAALGDDGGAAVTEYLAGHGIAVASVSLRLKPAPALVIDAGADPRPALAVWDRAPSAERQRLRQAVVIARAYAEKVEAFNAGTGPAPTAAETQRALWVAIRLLEWHIRGGEP